MSEKINSKKIVRALTFSMFLNMFLLGLFLGTLVFDKKPRARFSKGLSNYYKTLNLNEDEVKVFYRKIKQGRKEIKIALMQEPFSKQNLELAFENFEKADRDFKQFISSRIIHEAGKCPAQKRLELLPPKFKRGLRQR